MPEKKNIFLSLFDIRPVKSTGDLDMEKIRKATGPVNLRGKRKREDSLTKIDLKPSDNFSQSPVSLVSQNDFNRLPSKEEILADLELIDRIDDLLEKGKIELVSIPEEQKEAPIEPESIRIEEKVEIKKEKKKRKKEKKIKEPFKPHSELEAIYLSEDFKEVLKPKKEEKEESYSQLDKFWQKQPDPLPRQSLLKSLLGFLIAGFIISLIVPGAAWFSQGLDIKDNILSSGFSAVQNLLQAKKSIEETDWQNAEKGFSLAHKDFISAQQEVDKIGQITLNILGALPGGSLVSSGSHLVKMGESIAQAGQSLSSAISLFSFDEMFSLINLPQDNSTLAVKNGHYLTDLISQSQDKLEQTLNSIITANKELAKVETKALPESIQEEVVSLKEKMPLVEELIGQAADYSKNLLKILGDENPRQYLLIFQNNSEIRATGGFIGTYGLLNLYKGQIKELFIDGVYNADGQLIDKVIPPRPIQKVSTAWSMHDANWFADFPTSAEKISWFYEKTGGPTVDGVLSFTPTVIERLLDLTGPIDMPEYEVTLDSKNFVELIQYKVEVDYDKELNRPKQILADFAPIFIKKLNNLSAEKQKEAIEIIFDALKQKHIMMYFKDDSLEEFIEKEGWAGQLIETDKDYLSVVSTNINGFKTDRVIEETISHQAEVQEDGSIIDTLTVVRKHQGGRMEYDWWNRVNSNYLRVYLPLGTELISVKGQTFENYQPPINYQEHNFKIDPLVSSIESNMVVDQKTNTRIFRENDKTVFANWVYVSPGETVTITYQYKLPFKINLTKSVDSYTLLAQKQSGSLASNFNHELIYPKDWNISWQYPEDLKINSGRINYSDDLETDRFIGITFGF